MPGTVAIRRVPRDINKVREAELVITFTCVSDSSAGTLPDTTLQGLGEFNLVYIQPVPGATPATGTFSVIIDDADGAEIFDSDEFEVGDTRPVSGESGSPTGNKPSLTDEMTLKVANPINHQAQANIGNSKQLVIIMGLKKK